MNKRVAIYLRLSNEDSNKINECESIKNQRLLLLNEINKRENFILVDEYCDEDLSGAGTYRPEFERLIKDCENNKIDIVMCKSQSRFSRDMEIIEKYLHNKFIEWNIRFISIADNVDTNIKENKKSRQINGLVNEWYLEDVSNNIRSAFKTKMQEGEFISPFASYGYKISSYNKNKLEIDSIAALIVKKIYNLYLKGMGYTKIVNYLNDSNIPSPSFYKYQNGIKLNIVSNKPINEIKWSINTVKTILTNEIYIGNLIQGKRTTISYKNHKIINKNKHEWIKKENTHEPIIDKETYYKVQSIIKNKHRQNKKNGLIHIFSKKVYCDECKKTFRKKTSKNNTYLVCSNTKCINKKSIRYDELEEIILNKINNLINKNFNYKYINNYFNNIKSLDKINNIKKEIKVKKNKINNNKKYVRVLYEDKVNNIITNNQFIELIKEYNNLENKYNYELKILNNEIKKLKENKINVNKYKNFKNLNKLIIDEFIEKITIGNLKDNIRDIKIIWNF